MKIISPTDETYLELMVECQIAMAKETEEMDLNKDLVTAGMREVILTPTRGKYYLALNERDELMGMLLTMPEWSDWRCAEVIWIHSVYVFQNYRKQSVFKKLYHHLKDIVDSDSAYAGLRLYVDKTNKDAISVYNNIGMSDEHYSLFEYLK